MASAGRRLHTIDLTRAVREAEAVAAIVDPVPGFRRGLRDALEAVGIAVDEPHAVEDWIAAAGQRLLLLTLGHREDLRRLADYRRQARGLTLVALVPRLTYEACVEALVVGAMAVVDRMETTERIAAVAAVAIDGGSLLPTDVARRLALDVRDGWPPDWLTQDHVQWLCALADGTTVAGLATDVGFSERAMYRRLHDLYARMGVADLRGAPSSRRRAGDC